MNKINKKKNNKENKRFSKRIKIFYNNSDFYQFYIFIFFFSNWTVKF